MTNLEENLGKIADKLMCLIEEVRTESLDHLHGAVSHTILDMEKFSVI